ncbi:2-hydroxyacid dehydrogenase [Amaricoccus macauensis]|uniref:2-hydroxyacid dehydrogenase n=1 Tax=Amaricoccus macauensis TaxID=57001 RepID=UPI003C7EBB09
MQKILFSVSESEFRAFAGPIETACRAAGLDPTISKQPQDPTSIDYIVFSPDGPIADFSPFTGLKAALSLWAGVERIVGNETLKAPLARMVDPGLTEGMVEYVTGHVLRYHLGLDAILATQRGRWAPELAPPLARNRTVGILGLGALGAACGLALASLGFSVAGWSRRPKEIDGIECFSGDAGLNEILRRSDILVSLLPATPQTESILGAEEFALLPEGACLINPGRGTLIDDDALLAALDGGPLAHATLDVFRTEPLPADHPFWEHPKVTVTPHIAAATRPETAGEVIAENIRRSEAGLSLLHLVDRLAGY